MRVTADNHIYAEVGEKFNILLLFLVDVVAVFSTPMREHNNNVSVLTGNFDVLGNLLFFKHIYKIRFVVGNRNTVCAVGVVKQCKLNSVFLIIIDFIIILVAEVCADSHNFRVLCKKRFFVFNTLAAHIENMVVSAGEDIKSCTY